MRKTTCDRAGCKEETDGTLRVLNTWMTSMGEEVDSEYDFCSWQHLIDFAKKEDAVLHGNTKRTRRR